jgi:hypothetical protein
MQHSNNWIDEAFNSIKHQQQPVLAADLFTKIAEKVNEPGAKVVPLLNWKIAAAACIIFAINIIAFQKINADNVEVSANENQLISNYNIYAK